ncbi:MAG: FAD-dependent oxidoreductase, partial [Pseudomonadota bacterium]
MEPECHVNVIVVGGGAAGLAAASAAEEAGLSCQLLEAQKRLGGRISTVPLKSGGVFDEGAQMINGDMTAVLAVARHADLHLSPIVQSGIGLCVLGDRTIRTEDVLSFDEVFERLEERTAPWGIVIDALRAFQRTYKDEVPPWTTAIALLRALRILPHAQPLPRGSLAEALRALSLHDDEHAIAHSVFAEILGRPGVDVDARAVVDLYLRYGSERD